MKKFAWFVFFIIIFALGYLLAMINSFRSRLDNDPYFFRMQQVPNCEEKFIRSLDFPINNTLKSGKYVLEICLPEKPPKKTVLDLPFKEGQFDFPPAKEPKRGGMQESARIDYPLVSWHEEGRGYDAGVSYVGVVQDDMMWGRVYGYGQDPKEEIGFWKIYPKHPTETPSK